MQNLVKYGLLLLLLFGGLIFYLNYDKILNSTYGFTNVKISKLNCWSNGHQSSEIFDTKHPAIQLAAGVSFNKTSGALHGKDLFKKMSTVSPSYDKYAKESSCSGPSVERWQKLRALFVWWIHFSKLNNITWFLTYGSLIGAYRHNNMLPWDSDADVGIFRQDEAIVRKFQTSRDQVRLDSISLVTRPGEYCPISGSRLSCNGRSVNRLLDECSFCGPLARVVTKSTYVDLYLYALELDHETHQIKIQDEGMSEYNYPNTKYYIEPELILPLTNCSFMDLTLPCPTKVKQFLKKLYKTLRPTYKCQNKKWIDNS